MYRTIQLALEASIRQILAAKYRLAADGPDAPKIVIEQPPKIELGEFALPIAFELAKKLRKAPRAIATELAAELNAAVAAGQNDDLECIASVEVAGAGYLNIRLDRAAVARRIAAGEHADIGGPGFRLVEHTSINPNKAAHIGHLRNAILGDTFQRLLRPDDFKSGWQVGVQNYIDNTGVQVADVVVGLTQLEGRDLASTHSLLADLAAHGERIDFYCWDLYARVSQWYAGSGSDDAAPPAPEELVRRKQIRLDTLHALEHGGNETAEIADLISTAVLRRHLETMERLSIEYDFLPRESEILSLHFWDAARALMIERGVLYLETEGKNKGCWVMRRAGNADESITNPGAPGASPLGAWEEKQGRVPGGKEETSVPGAPGASPLGTWVEKQGRVPDGKEETSVPGAPGASPLGAWEEKQGPDEGAKVLVRSNGTVTYVGKDIAYHLWKFGLLPGKDFGYAKFREYSEQRTTYNGQPAPRTCWISTAGASDPAAPRFGHAHAIYNVIDSRQNDPQNNVIAALRGMGFTEAADRYTHFSYEMVAMTPRCAEDLGYALTAEDKARPFIEVSGRKGFGVKADDLLDKLTAAAQAEVDTRHPEITSAERSQIAVQIAVGALRYFMLRFTRNTVIAFDFRDALSFEGETGPYVQYAIVRAANIFRKAGVDEAAALAAVADLDLSALDGEDGTSLWETWLLASRLTALIEQAIATAEPAHLARYAFQLAQQFNNFYHRHHILTEQDPTRRALLLATAAIARREMVRALAYLGIESPAVM